MFEKIGILNMAQALARHAGARQSVIAQNVANADTPGYRARDLVSFSEAFRGGEASAMRATRRGHLGSAPGQWEPPTGKEIFRPGATSPNGNSVSLEAEIFAAAEVKADHDRALAVYNAAMNILRTSATGRR